MAEPLAPFDPNATFVAPRPMRFNGEAVLPGGVLNTSGIPERKLAQLYKTRAIRVQGEGEDGEPAPAPKLSDEDQARADRLVDTNNRAQLEALAKGKVTAPESFANKPLLAEAIVRADPDAGKAQAGGDDGEGGEIEVGSAVLIEGGDHDGQKATVVSIDGDQATIKRAEGGEAIEAVELATLKLDPPAE